MGEAERASFIKYMVTRPPGKRQVKPTSLVTEQLAALSNSNDDDDDDTEWNETRSQSDDGSSASGSESSSDSNSDEEPSDEEENLQDEDQLSTLKDAVHLGDTAESAVLVCGLCLNLRDEVRKDEVIQCDKCGVCVHEACYSTDLGEDADSTLSASSTEPWFCEPCLFGLVEPPNCEFCPDRYGAFKRCDIGGGWAHLLCALYIPGLTFGDAEKLTAVSYQEIDFAKNFGKKTCSGCTNKVDARVGIAVQCDAALCKTYYHPTCAHRLGLTADHHDDDSDSPESVFVSCKKHSCEETVRKRRIAHMKFQRHEERRMITLKRKKLTEREERFRIRNRERLTAVHKGLEGVTVVWPGAAFDKAEMKQRRIRPIHTSMKWVDAFAEKAETECGISREEFDKEFFRVKGENLAFLPPGFSQEFVAYFDNRERVVLAQEKKRLETIQSENEKLRERLRELEGTAHKVSGHNKEHVLDLALDRITNLHSALVKLGVKKLENPFKELIAERKKHPTRRRTSSVSSSSSPTKHHVRKLVLRECNECHKTTDQHKLIECDMCHFNYHLGCLDPPLEKMPKKTNFDWHCSNCISDDEEDDEEEKEEAVEEGPRKLRQRSDALKARKLQEAEAERRAYASVMRTARHVGKRAVSNKARSLTPKVENQKLTTSLLPLQQKKRKSVPLVAPKDEPIEEAEPTKRPTFAKKSPRSVLKTATNAPNAHTHTNGLSNQNVEASISPSSFSLSPTPGSRSSSRNKRHTLSPEPKKMKRNVSTRQNSAAAMHEFGLEESDDDSDAFVTIGR